MAPLPLDLDPKIAYLYFTACTNYHNLTDHTRHFTKEKGVGVSNQGDKIGCEGELEESSADWRGKGFYRFQYRGSSGRMATRKEVKKDWLCDAMLPGYLDVEEHPQLKPGHMQTVKVCFHWGESNKCDTETKVNIIHCKNFFVYELDDLSCYDRYCGA